MTTPAVAYLRKHQIPFQLIRYDHEQKGAEFAARALGFPLEKTVKTLVVGLGKGEYALVLMPGHRQLSFKRVAQVFNVKRAAMADITTAERLTGYSVGGISPFGVKKRLASAIETELLQHDAVMINAGQRGAMLKMEPGDIVSALGCKAAELSPPITDRRMTSDTEK